MSDKYKNQVLIFMLLGYIGFIYWFCVFSRNLSTYDVRPIGWSFINMWNYWWESFLYIQTIGNLLLYVPLGILSALCWKNKPFLSALFCGIIVCISVEVLQYLLACGTLDFDDVVNNIMGTLVGCGIIQSIRKKRIDSKLIGIVALYMVLAVKVVWVWYSR